MALAWDASQTASSNATRFANHPLVMERPLKTGAPRRHRCARLEEFVPMTSPATLWGLRPGKQRVAWFMSMSKPDDAVSNTYVAFAKAATASARLNAPSLAPWRGGAASPSNRKTATDAARAVAQVLCVHVPAPPGRRRGGR